MTYHIKLFSIEQSGDEWRVYYHGVVGHPTTVATTRSPEDAARILRVLCPED